MEVPPSTPARETSAPSEGKVRQRAGWTLPAFPSLAIQFTQRANHNVNSVRCMERLVSNGAVGKACQVLLSDEVQDDEHLVVRQRLKDLHPAKDPPGWGPPNKLEAIPSPADEDERRERLSMVRKAVFSFENNVEQDRPDHAE